MIFYWLIAIKFMNAIGFNINYMPFKNNLLRTMKTTFRKNKSIYFSKISEIKEKI